MTTQVAVLPDYWRQLGIVTPAQLNFPITMIGAGGIGSPTALVLAKMGCSNLTVFDADTIEEHNFPNQLYRLSDYEAPKVEALADVIRSFTGTQITVRNERYEGQPLSGVVISCVDSMAVRQQIWQRVRLNINVPLYIDARMGGQVAHVYAFAPRLPDRIRQYEATLYSDEESVEEPCTERAIIYNVFMIASIIGVFVKKFARGEDLPLEGIVKLVDLNALALYN